MVCSAGGLYPSTLRGLIVIMFRRHCSINTLVSIRMEEISPSTSRAPDRPRNFVFLPVSHAFDNRRGNRPKLATPSLPFTVWFTEGFDTADLKKAKERLDVLA